MPKSTSGRLPLLAASALRTQTVSRAGRDRRAQHDRMEALLACQGSADRLSHAADGGEVLRAIRARTEYRRR